MDAPTFSDAVPPERFSSIDSYGIRLHLCEWGDPQGPPIVLHHGMFDHARGFDRLAPLLADRFRVVALDARGHGESGWADLYTWSMDVADIVNVLRWLDRPALLLGHSKGGGQAVDAAIASPERVRAVVNLDGFGPPDDADRPHRRETNATTAPEHFAEFLDWRREAGANRAWRYYPDLEAMVARRSSQNPRLSVEWLRYFVYHAARRTAAGWHWKVDPHAARGFGPWRPAWVADAYAHLTVPLLAIVGSEPDTWGPLPEAVLAERLGRVANLRRAVVAESGHFIHMEQPFRTAELVLDFAESL